MSCTGHTDRSEKELDFRVNDGVEVALLWRRCDERLIVQVIDTKRADAFRLEVGPTEAVDVFQHPYAYAAFRGVDYLEPRQLQAEMASE
jgi:hypothetical protein